MRRLYLLLCKLFLKTMKKFLRPSEQGAHGYFLKKTPAQRLIEGIREVMAGGAPMTPAVARKVLEMYHEKQPVTAKQAQFNLSERELEILSLLVKGMSYKMMRRCGRYQAGIR